MSECYVIRAKISTQYTQYSYIHVSVSNIYVRKPKVLHIAGFISKPLQYQYRYFVPIYINGE